MPEIAHGDAKSWDGGRVRTALTRGLVRAMVSARYSPRRELSTLTKMNGSGSSPGIVTVGIEASTPVGTASTVICAGASHVIVAAGIDAVLGCQPAQK